MSECVVRMEMPKNCYECEMRGAWAFCPIGKWSVVGYKKQRHENCPILCSTPEGHGRIIDADEFLKRAIGTKCFDEDDSRMLEELVGESITIVPAEAERSANECKQKKYTNWVGEEMVEQQINKDVSRFADGEWWKE